jgi:hypothetical protein
MSLSLEKKFSKAFNLPIALISAKESAIFWRIYQHVLRQVDILTPEILQYCEKEVIKKILYEDKQILSIILHECLMEILSFIKERKKVFRLGVYLYKPPDIPEWEGLTILINVEFSTFQEKLLLWEELEKRITQLFDKIKRQYPEQIEQIQEANKLIATSIQPLE